MTALPLDVTNLILSADGEADLTVADEVVLGAALHHAGVEFTNGGQPGVCLRKAEPSTV